MKTYVTKNYRMDGRFKTGLMLFTIVRLVSITVATVMLVLAYISSDALRLAYTILVIGLCALVSGMVSAGFFAKSTDDAKRKKQIMVKSIAVCVACVAGLATAVINPRHIPFLLWPLLSTWYWSSMDFITIVVPVLFAINLVVDIVVLTCNNKRTDDVAIV